MTKRQVPSNVNFTGQDGDGEVIVFTHYYVIYYSTYDEADGEMKHNPTNNWVAPEQYNAPNSKYKYDSSQEEYYLRIRDEGR